MTGIIIVLDFILLSKIQFVATKEKTLSSGTHPIYIDNQYSGRTVKKEARESENTQLEANMNEEACLNE